jgi:hypothetical protein
LQSFGDVLPPDMSAALQSVSENPAVAQRCGVRVERRTGSQAGARQSLVKFITGRRCRASIEYPPLHPRDRNSAGISCSRRGADISRLRTAAERQRDIATLSGGGEWGLTRPRRRKAHRGCSSRWPSAVCGAPALMKESQPARSPSSNPRASAGAKKMPRMCSRATWMFASGLKERDRVERKSPFRFYVKPPPPPPPPPKGATAAPPPR